MQELYHELLKQPSGAKWPLNIDNKELRGIFRIMVRSDKECHVELCHTCIHFAL
jgi:hypothetical protein